MTETKDPPEDPGAADDQRGLEDKMRDYHRRGGPQGGSDAKRIEGDITSAAITADDDLKKGRPPSRPAGHE
jgi:hypothetical protein